MKKHRGLKRYYKNLVTQNDFLKADLANLNSTEFNNQHLHFDLRGYGNDSFKRREPHLDKLFRHFEVLADRSQDLKHLQVYAVVLDFDSSSDALFLQKPMFDNSQFPFKVDKLSKTSTLTNDLLNYYISNLKGYQKLYGKADEAFCLLYKSNVGLLLN